MATRKSIAGQRPRLLIFVIAYYAETTLREVLERIPSALLRELDCEVLVVDDASSDRTFEVGRDYRDAHPALRLTVLRNQFNQGYGGNQKVGYAYAIAHGFDFVAMVHGDGQYAPEALPLLLAPLLDGRADAVIGSRMLTPWGALRGGMPLYKFIGNHVLTLCQNALLGTQLSEFHSGYRLYSVAALERIPLRLNSNEFHFDTEILIQLLNARQRIVELPIPTHYGAEISRVNGIKYAKDVLLATLENTLHRAGLRYQRRYDPFADDDHAAHSGGSKLSYPSSHSYALARVPHGARVLQIGSAPRELERELQRRRCSVTVADGSEQATPEPRIHIAELERAPQLAAGYDCILMLDVIGRLRDPERFLENLRRGFDEKPRALILTTPNVAFCAVRLMLLLGQFNYGRRGILALMHKRLFTFRSIARLLAEGGFRIRELHGLPAPFPRLLGEGRLAPLARLCLRCNRAAIALSKALFAYEICVVAQATPDIDHALRTARSSAWAPIGR